MPWLSMLEVAAPPPPPKPEPAGVVAAGVIGSAVASAPPDIEAPSLCAAWPLAAFLVVVVALVVVLVVVFFVVFLGVSQESEEPQPLWADAVVANKPDTSKERIMRFI